MQHKKSPLGVIFYALTSIINISINNLRGCSHAMTKAVANVGLPYMK